MRTCGGAATHPTRREIETPPGQRHSQYSQRKAAIAQALCYRKNLTIYTVNLFALSALANLPDARIHILCGKVRLASMSAQGSQTLVALSRITVDRVFPSVDGVVANYGLCEASPEQTWLKQCMADRAIEVIVLADSSKLGMASQQHWTKFSRPWMLVTNSGADAEQLEHFRSQALIRLLIAPMNVSAG